MSLGGELSERALVLAPSGRDAAVAAAILKEGGMIAVACDTLDDLLSRMAEGAGLAVVVAEALTDSDLTALSEWIENQPSWSDFPFLVLNRRGGSVERNPAARRLSATLGNVSFLERPFHPTTLVSAVDTALRGRKRQYEARARIAEIQRAEALLERRVVERTAQLDAANQALAEQIKERERAETALRQAQRLEAVGQLTSGIAHDFNNLLTVVIGNAAGRPQELAAGDYVVVSVGDNGSGMTDEVLARAFEPFFTTKDVGKGSGLGLSQVFGLAKQSGGGVSIDTEVGRGTTIRIFLPRAAHAPMCEAEAGGEALAARDAGLVVLVVDDDEAVRHVTAGLLADLGYQVVEADSGVAALAALDRHDKIDAMVLDFAMPGMNGGELARTLRVRRPAAPILFATGYADAEALVDVGEEMIVRKPFTQAELANKLSRTLAAA